MSRSRQRPTRLATCFGVAAALTLAFPSLAQTTEERLMSDPPAAWWFFQNTPTSDLSNLIASQNARIIGLKVDDPAAPTFSAILVSNTGAWGKGWWWYYGMSAADLLSILSTNNARPITVYPYDVGGTLYFAAVMVSNTGADLKGWWYDYDRSTSELLNLVIARGARIVDFRSYLRAGTRYYSAVMIPNTGADAHAWWFYAGATAAQLATIAQADQARLYSIAVSDPVAGTFDAILVACPCPGWWSDTGISGSDLLTASLTRNSRIVAGETYDPGTGLVWAAVSMTMDPGTGLFPITPCRVVDTRNAVGPDAASPALTPFQERTFDASFTTRCGIPSGARSLVLNITAVQPAAPGYFSLFPGGTAWPGTTSISFTAGRTRTNNGIAQLGADGSLVVKNGAVGTADLVLDVSGYFR